MTSKHGRRWVLFLYTLLFLGAGFLLDLNALMSLGFLKDATFIHSKETQLYLSLLSTEEAVGLEWGCIDVWSQIRWWGALDMGEEWACCTQLKWEIGNINIEGSKPLGTEQRWLFGSDKLH